MPLYEYECDACGRRFEKIQKFSDPLPERCDLCGSGPVRKLFSSPAIQFKGSGWYITDYAKKGTSEAPEGAGANAAQSGDKAEKPADKPAGTAADKSPDGAAAKPDTKSGPTKSSDRAAKT